MRAAGLGPSSPALSQRSGAYARSCPAAGSDLRPPTVAEQHDFDGAVCFVDVSGFTALSEALAKQHGPVHGAELLNDYINSYFEKVRRPPAAAR